MGKHHSHLCHVLTHYTPWRIGRAVIGNPRYMFEMPEVPHAVRDWSLRAVTERFNNKETINDFIRRCEKEKPVHIVIALHGYFEVGQHCKSVYKSVFENEGIALFAPDYPTLRDIRFSARYTSLLLQKIFPETDASFSFLGHSLGCLVALETYYHRLSSPQQERVSSMLLLCGPHHGTREAVHGYGKSARQMEKGSAYIQEWELCYPKLSDGTKIWSFYASHDALVQREDARLPIPDAMNLGFHEIGISGRTSHLGALYRKDVAHLIREIIVLSYRGRT